MNNADSVKSPSPATAPTAMATASKQQLKSNNAKNLEGARKQAASPVDGHNRKQQTGKAWQGTNPFTQKATANVTNGVEKPLPKTPQQTQQSKSTSEGQADKHAHDRALFLIAQFIGKDAVINLRNGEQFSGVFSGASLESTKTHYVLKMVKRTKQASDVQLNGSTKQPEDYIGQGADHSMAFSITDVISLSVDNVILASASKQSNGTADSSFLTDTQISNREQHMSRERELQRWEPGPDSSIGMALEDSGEASWDQFAANERLYGVQSTYDENFYTTAIDRSTPYFRQRQAEADRIAREIEGSTAATAHIAEERRKDGVGDDGSDEEEKYSGVKRDTAQLPKRAAGAYIPPSARPITGAPTVPGAPFDPAIISTKISQPTASTDVSAIRTSPSPPEPSAPSVSERSLSTAPTETSREAQPAPAAQAAAAAQMPPKPKENTTEDHVRGTADAFKQFANNEKLRIKQAQEAKRSNARQEKNVKLNDLKKFAANFKLKSRVPDDLVPILAKDREKQLEIQKKAEDAAREEESRVKERDPEKPSASNLPASMNSTQQPGAAPAADSRLPPHHRQRPSQSHIRQQAPPVAGQSPRAPRMHQPPFNRAAPPQLPTDLRTFAPNLAVDAQMSPSSATRLNVNAKEFEFRPGASTFQPSGASPSPRRDSPVSFFDNGSVSLLRTLASVYDPFTRMAEANGEDNAKKFAQNGGLPHAYRTSPTWPVTKENDAVKYLSFFPKSQAANQGPTSMPTSNPNMGISHNMQMPAHVPGQVLPNASQRPPYFPASQPGHPAPFDPRFAHFSGPNGSVQNSPRVQNLGPLFNNQLHGMPMPGYPSQPVPGGYGMSPSMQYRQLPGPGGPVMMMPGQSQGQLPMRPGYAQGPQYQGPQMGGHMMVHNPSGGYMGGPLPNPSYSPMPHQAQLHMPHMQHGAPVGYSNSPRPPMMQPQGSQQGYQPHMHMQPGFVPSPSQTHQYHMQQRAMSSQFPQMTPRQQQAVPQHPSPGVAGINAQGDEGK